MDTMFGFLGTPTFDFVLTLGVLNIVVLVLLNSGFHHLYKHRKNWKSSNTMSILLKSIDGSEDCCLRYSSVSKLIFISIYKVLVVFLS